ncbi:MAG: futalosine hydrolase [Halobacteria archaeon]|nr:futalosine hydrolase [Halobacteria archaeon]
MADRLVCVAMEEEAEAVLGEREAEAVDEVLGRPVYSCGDSLVVVTGIGRSNAAASVTLALERYDIEKVVDAGIGGAFRDTAVEVGDVVMGTRAVHADLGLTSDEFHGMEDLGFETAPGRYNEYDLSPVNVETDGSGAVATVSSVSANDRTAREIRERTGAVVEDMETAGVAQVCYLRDVEVSAVIAVSNYTGDGGEWDFEKGLDALSDAVDEII